MVETYKPNLKDLWFRQSLMADPETMSFNDAWGGTIPFPKERWQDWYHNWLESPESLRYYRYLRDPEKKCFVGEIAYHFDEDRNITICDVIVLAKYRRHGYGTAGINLICKAAKENGVAMLYDDIAANNPSYQIFLKNGFEIDYQNDNVVMVRKVL